MKNRRNAGPCGYLKSHMSEQCCGAEDCYWDHAIRTQIDAVGKATGLHFKNLNEARI